MMNNKLLKKLASKLKQKHPHSPIQRIKSIPEGLRPQEKAFLRKILRDPQYYKDLKKEQCDEREDRFFEAFAATNPLRSQNRDVANRKERELLKEVFVKKMARTRLDTFLKSYVIPCDTLRPLEEYVLTNELLISCISKRLRPYKKVRATALGGNVFKYYLIKENWKRESTNHIIWKFELKKRYSCRLEHKVGKYRVDLYKRFKHKRIIIEIVCTRQAITKEFEQKIKTFTEHQRIITLILAPTRLHKYLKHLIDRRVGLLNTRNVIPFLDKLLAHKKCEEKA